MRKRKSTRGLGYQHAYAQLTLVMQSIVPQHPFSSHFILPISFTNNWFQIHFPFSGSLLVTLVHSFTILSSFFFICAVSYDIELPQFKVPPTLFLLTGNSIFYLIMKTKWLRIVSRIILHHTYPPIYQSIHAHIPNFQKSCFAFYPVIKCLSRVQSSNLCTNSLMFPS